MERYYYVVIRKAHEYNARQLVIILPDDPELDELVGMALQGVNMTSNMVLAHDSILEIPSMKKSIVQLKRHMAPPKIIKLFKKSAVKLLGD